ncbi:MAG: M48 family metallopeptidase [Phascolarctobacterium sp.]|nr:M48 family metallopeptidase [Phascolarctobacterium sp.]
MAVILKNLNPKSYEHPLDARALEALNGTPGLESLTRLLMKHGIERVYRIKYTGSYLKAKRDLSPTIYDVFEEACTILDMDKKPDLYIQWGYDINACTIGVERPLLALYSGCIDLLTRKELLFVIGHELGHIKSEHTLYHLMATALPVLGQVVGNATFGIGGIVSTALELALLHWQRMSEFTADRAGLLCCQDATAGYSAMLKIAGLPRGLYGKAQLDSFVEQAREFEGYDYDSMDKIVKTVSIMGDNHPWVVMRGHELLQWMDTGAYDEILNKRYLQ